MEWYFGSGIDDVVVPNDGGSDRLPSPDSWSKWGISASECFQSSNKFFSTYPQFTKELNISGISLFDEVEMGNSVNEKDPSSSSSVSEGLSEDSLQQNTLSYNQGNSQLDDLAGLQQMDDIFMSSLLDDLPGAENVQKSFFYSPDSNGMLSADDISTNMVSESQSISSSAQSAGSSKYLKTHAFSPAVGSDKGHTTTSQYTACNPGQKDCPPVKALAVRVVSPSEQHSMNGLMGEETSVEESVLHELEMVMEQFTEKTRICFRDALYRLANNSKGNHIAQRQDGDQLQPSSLTVHDERIRSGNKKGTESETNTIDRAIANLMFNEIGVNAQELSGEAPLDSKQEVVGATGNLYHSHHHSILPNDAEVPMLQSFSSNSSGKRKTPMREYGITTGV